ncbi:type II secretion system protein [Photobacterium kagoshimensis]|uniref:type II secretion system protein n=1 Tax=Photobacterium kagoshimensis TaxID=2910242 RepID=UPI003D10F8E0
MTNKGFTLIELIVTIVVLGILAVTAAPKFMNIQGDARKATLSGVEGALKSSVGIVYGKAALNGAEKGQAFVEVNNKNIAVIDGTPVASKANLDHIVQTDIHTFNGITNGQTGPHVVVFGFQKTATAVYESQCYLQATNISNNSETIFVTTIFSDGC